MPQWRDRRALHVRRRYGLTTPGLADLVRPLLVMRAWACRGRRVAVAVMLAAASAGCAGPGGTTAEPPAASSDGLTAFTDCATYAEHMRRLALARVGEDGLRQADDRRRRIELASDVPGAALGNGPASPGTDPALPDVVATDGHLLVTVRLVNSRPRLLIDERGRPVASSSRPNTTAPPAVLARRSALSSRPCPPARPRAPGSRGCGRARRPMSTRPEFVEVC